MRTKTLEEQINQFMQGSLLPNADTTDEELIQIKKDLTKRFAEFVELYTKSLVYDIRHKVVTYTKIELMQYLEKKYLQVTN